MEHQLDSDPAGWPDRKSTRLNSSHLGIPYAVFCLKKKEIGRAPWCIRMKRDGACGAVGSALPWHGRGREFESHQVHQTFLFFTIRPPSKSSLLPNSAPSR